jgi:hypothetical protein
MMIIIVTMQDDNSNNAWNVSIRDHFSDDNDADVALFLSWYWWYLLNYRTR